METLAAAVEQKSSCYDPMKDRDLMKEEDDMKTENPNPLFRAGQSHRVWGELYKVSPHLRPCLTLIAILRRNVVMMNDDDGPPSSSTTFND